MKTIQINPALGVPEDLENWQILEEYKRQVYGNNPPLCQYKNNLDKLTDLIFYFCHRPRVYQ